MSWSYTLNDITTRDVLPPELLREWRTAHESYPADMNAGFQAAKAMGLNAATISGGRTPHPDGSEMAALTIIGHPQSTNFFATVHRAVQDGPGYDTPAARHQRALERLKARPCSHRFSVPDTDSVMTCTNCTVHMRGTLMYYDD